MNDRHAQALQRMLAASHPDDLVKVEGQPGGVRIEISGPGASPASTMTARATLSLTDDSAFLSRLIIGSLLRGASEQRG